MEEMIKNIELGQHVHIDWKLRLQYMIKKEFLLKDSCSLALGLFNYLLLVIIL